MKEESRYKIRTGTDSKRRASRVGQSGSRDARGMPFTLINEKLDKIMELLEQLVSEGSEE